MAGESLTPARYVFLSGAAPEGGDARQCDRGFRHRAPLDTLPADPPDTSWGPIIVSQGSGKISGQDQATGCNWSKTIKPPACTPEFHELVAHWRVAGWVQLAEPAPESSHAR